MHTTTVRFDRETWVRIKRTCEELDIAVAEYIRTATVQRLERGDLVERMTGLETRMIDLEKIVAGFERLVRRLLRRG